MSEQVVKLTDLRPGQAARVEAFTTNGANMYRLMEMGLIPGTMIRYVRPAPMGDPLEFEIRGYNLSLRRAEAESISVAV